MLTHLASQKKRSVWVPSILALLIVVGTALASQGVVQDRTVSEAEAKQWAKKAAEGSNFPIGVNSHVLRELNYWVGTPDGREYFRAALERMKEYQPTIEKKIAEYGVPKELMAIPIVESGYKNNPPKLNKHLYGAGLWMFIEGTAKRYNLKIEKGGLDERNDPEKETDAAMRYLSHNYKFLKNNWPLAILAYNMGESAVDKAAKKYGYDAWKLVDNGIENDKAYLARVIAAMIVMKNTSLLE